MKLLIRSQDRKILCCPNKIVIYEHFEKNEYGLFEIRSDWGVLGVYTEQRALEVLDEIQKMINNNGAQNGEYDKITGCYYVVRKNVYEMPKE